MQCPTALAAAACAALVAATTASAGPLRAQGSEWLLQLPDGSAMRSADLIGAELTLGDGNRLRLDAVQARTDAAGQLWWGHMLSAWQSGAGWQPLCRPHLDGTTDAVVIPGRETSAGALAADPSSFAISCTSGALAKCVRMGYRSDLDLPQFNACVRMVRADYGGQGQAYTENGKIIDVYDDAGIQRADNSADQIFEAGWNEQGAVCVHHLRVPGQLTLDALAARHPQLAGRTGNVCTEAFARAHGATVFNRSNDIETAGR